MDAGLERRLRDMLDREAIRETIFSYAEAIDRGDREGCAALFTADAILHIGVHDGPAKALFTRPRPAHLVATHHMLGNIRIRLDGDRARAITYIAAVHRNRSADGFANHLFRARYLDVLVREGEVWRISERTSIRDWSCALPDSEASLADAAGANVHGGGYGPDDPAFGFLEGSGGG